MRLTKWDAGLDVVWLDSYEISALAYYNENDPKARMVARADTPGHIADGCRREIYSRRTPMDVAGTLSVTFSQYRGWSYALRLAGWSDARPRMDWILPCQPFSGRQREGLLTSASLACLVLAHRKVPSEIIL